MATETPACSPAEVLERACALAGVVTVYTMERDFPRVPPGERDQFAKDYDLLRGIYRSAPPKGLHLSPAERAILEKRLGSWSTADQLNAAWGTEGAAILGWAVGLIDAIAPYDQMVRYERIQPLTALDLRQKAVPLRDSEALDHALTEAKQWHWRARQAQGYFPDGSVDALQGGAAKRRQETIRRALGSSPQLFGKPYEELTFKEWSLAHSIALERHRALQWLWDGGPWDDVQTDT